MTRNFLILVSFLMLSGCSQLNWKPQAETRESVQVGRYTIVSNSNTPQSYIMIDTATGHTWALVEDSNHENWWASLKRQSVTDPSKFEGEK